MEENQHMKLLRKRKHLHGLVGLALVLEDVFIVMEEVHTSHALITNCDVLKYQAVDQSVLHPPEQLRLVLHHTTGSDGDILEGDRLGKALTF